ELAIQQGRFPWVTMIGNPQNSGFGTGCNIGVERATGEQLLFMNPDVIAAVEEIRALMFEKARHPDVGIITSRQVGTNGRSQKVFDEFPGFLNQSKLLKFLIRFLMPLRQPNPRGRHDSLVYCDWITGSFLLIDSADLNRIGGWSRDYWMYVEDADLCKRAQDAGLQAAYTPDVQVIHEHGGSSRINVDVKTMTKLEVIISKHVYVQNHFSGIRRLATHLFIALLRLPGLVLASVMNILTLSRVTNLKIRCRMLSGLLRYYQGVIRSGNWLSARAQANQVAQS
ncbi:MAG: glycosyltransferase family 2 protein, partial [Woeseiaceae bacterium]|nr:glycosyltransferase family 2 protein [Woeseiaceae bacterium]